MSEPTTSTQPVQQASQPSAAPGELTAEVLRWRCPLDVLDFETTALLPEPGIPLGQARAMDALRLGAGIVSPAHHIYAMGEPGTGKHALLRQALEQEARTKPRPHDWCYVTRFDDPRRPRVLQLEAGRAAALKNDMRALMEELGAALPAAFESDTYRNRRKEIDHEIQNRAEQALATLQSEAEKHQLGIVATPGGFAITPIHDDRPLDEEAFKSLPAEQREAAQREMPKLMEMLRLHFEQLPQWQRERRQKIRELDRHVINLAIRGAIGALQTKYHDHPEVFAYLKDVESDLEEHPHLFQTEQHAGASESISELHERARYEVNVLVDNTATQGAPIIYESSPSYQNLVGRVDNIAHEGALSTNLTMIRSGALHRANGGYLMLDATRLLMHPYAWEALKRSLQTHEIRIESLGQMLSLISTVTLEPDPVPLDAKVCLVGPRLLYYLLCRYDEDFAALFTVVADFSECIDRTADTLALYARLLGSLARSASLQPLDRSAAACAIEHAARVTGDAQRLSAQVVPITDLLREADHYARIAGHQTITREDVKTAIDAQIGRQDRLRDEMLKQMQRHTIVIQTDGSATAQINGLSLIDLGSFAFGQPARITATVHLGEGEVVDIAREVKLGGAIHSKGVLTLASYIGSHYAPESPLSLRASLVFEQTYGVVEGDSASLAETCALLSALSDTPVQQSTAVTGSIDQHGHVQAVGGINEKIEGFFDLCRQQGLTGRQGVLIPVDNVQHLMLREDVVSAVAEGRFHVYPVRIVDEAITVLSGILAGERQSDGRFPDGTINSRAEHRLLRFAHRRQEFIHETGERRRFAPTPPATY